MARHLPLSWMVPKTKEKSVSTKEGASKRVKNHLAEKVIICGVCKDVESALSAVISSVEETGSLFRDYQVFVYENNSQDNTAEILNKWEEKNRRVHITTENIPEKTLLSFCRAISWDNRPSRLELIVRARNIVLQQIMRHEYDDHRYVIWVDMDFKNGWDIKGIIDSLSQPQPWDGICANGVLPDGRMFDGHAYRDSQFPLGPELLGEYWWRKYLKKIMVVLDENIDLVPVISAFGGLAIYKRQSIQDCCYSGTVNYELYRLTKCLLRDGLKNGNKQVRFYFKHKSPLLVNGALMGAVLFEEKGSDMPIPWRNNSGYNYPVCIGHAAFHAAMANRGFHKIFVNPRMKTHYDLR